MIKSILTLITFFICFSLSAQERITDFEGNGTTQRIVLKTIDEVNYLITIDKSDIVTTYIEEDGILSYQHHIKMEGANTQRYYYMVENYLLLEQVARAVAYDFVSNSELSFPLLGQNEKSQWHVLSDQIATLRQYDPNFDNRIHYTIDFTTLQIDTIYGRNTILNSAPNYFLHRDEETIPGQQIFNIIDRNTGSSTEAFVGYLYAYQSDFNDYGFTFLNDSVIQNFDIETNEVKTLLPYPEDARSLKIYSIDIGTVIFIEESFEQHTTYLYDHNMELQSTFNFEGGINFIIPQVLNGRLFVADYSKSFSIDVVTGQRQVFSSTIEETLNYLIYQDRYILSKKNGSIYQIDYQNWTEKSIFSSDFDGSNHGITIIESQNQHYVNFDSPDAEVKSLFSLGQFSVSPPNLLPETNSGLSDNSRLMQTTHDLVLASTDIWDIDDKTLTQLNSGAITPFPYNNIRQDASKVTWIQAKNNVCEPASHKNGTQINYGELEGTNPNQFGADHVKDYAIIGNHIYYEMSKSGPGADLLFHYQADTKESTLITAMGVFDAFFALEDFVYYSKNDTLFRLDTLGNKFTVISDFKAHFIPERAVLDGAHYILNYDGIYKVSGQSVERIYDFDNEYSVSLRTFNDKLFFISGDSSFILYDGTDNHEVLLDSPNYLLRFYSDRFILLSQSIDINTSQNSVYDALTDEVKELPDEVNQLKIVSIIPNDDDIYYITSSTFSPAYNISIYRTDVSFSNFDLVEEFDAVSFGVNLDYINFDDEGGLLQIGNKHLILNDDFQIVKDLILPADPGSRGIFRQNDHFYFIAFDPILGRQVHRIPALQSSLQTTILKKDDNALLISPNPSANRIKIDLDSTKGNSPIVMIYSSQGQLIGQYTMDANNGIDVSALSSGLYYLKVIDGENIHAGTFVKN